MLAFLEGPELIIVLVIVLVVFGGSQLPRLARNLGQATQEFRKAADDTDRADTSASSVGNTSGSAPEAQETAPSPETAPAPEVGADPDPGTEKVTLTRAELDALLAQREAEARRQRDSRQTPGS